MTGKLNLEIAESVAGFKSLMDRILPKNIFYKLLLRGKGLEFDGYRKFGLDEDASSIDWKASVRSNSLLARQYVEERDIRAIFIVDVGDNMVFGSTKKLKCEYSAEVAASLANLMISVGDKIGFFLVGQDIVKMVFPKSGKKQFEVFTHELSLADNYGGNSGFKENLSSLIELIEPSISLIFLISDFISVDKSNSKRFEEFGNLFETVAIMIKDPLDKTLPEINKEVHIQDPVSKERLIINPILAKRIYEKKAKEQSEFVKKIFRENRIDCVELSTSEQFYFPLADFLKRRAEKR